MNIGFSFLRQIQGSLGSDDRQASDTNLTRVRGFIAQTFREVVSSIVSAYHTEHNVDDSHSTIHATGLIYERSRTIAMGDWTDAPFDAGNYTGAGSMSWTVTSGQQIVYNYWRVGTTLFVSYWIEGSAIGGTVASTLRIALPAMLTAAQFAVAPTHYVNGTAGVGFAVVNPGDRFVSLYRADSSSWSAASPVTAHGQLALKVSDAGDVTIASSDPVLTYSGAASGTVNFAALTQLSLTTPGTYSITVNRAMTLTFKGIAGGGGSGGSACWDGVTIGTSKGAGGGGGGEVTTGVSVSLLSGKTYTLVIGAAGTGGAGGASANASGSNGVAGGNTTLVNTTDTVNLVVLTGGGASSGSTTAAQSNGGGGGTGGTGTNRIAGGGGGNGGDVAANGSSAINGAAGGGGGGQSGNGPQSNGGNGGTGSVAGGTHGVAGDSVSTAATAGASVSPATGGAASGVHGGGGGGAGGGCQISGLTGTFGGGGGGAAGDSDSATGRTGGTGGPGAGLFVFVSAP